MRKHFASEHIIAQQGTIGKHYAFAHGCCTGSVIYQSQIIELIPLIDDVFFGEALRVCGFEVLFYQVVCPTVVLVVAADQFEVLHLYGCTQPGHFIGIQSLPNHIAHDKQFRIGVIDKVGNGVALEFMQQRNDHSPVCYAGKEGYCPISGVSSADNDFIASFYACGLEEDVQSCNPSRHFAVCYGFFLVIAQSR